MIKSIVLRMCESSFTDLVLQNESQSERDEDVHIGLSSCRIKLLLLLLPMRSVVVTWCKMCSIVFTKITP